MTTILMAADEDDKGFFEALYGMLSKHFVTARAFGRKLKVSGKSPDLLLCDAQSFEGIETDSVIVVYKKPQSIIARVASAIPAVAIVDSSQDELLEHVCATRLPAITCGLGSRDTITLSSMTAPGAVVDLRRGVTCLDGSRVEPQELPLRLEGPLDSFLLMCFAAILILSGKIESLKEGFI